MWMAGGEVKPDIQTDDFGYNTADADGDPLLSPSHERPSKDCFTSGAVHTHDLNVHLLGSHTTDLSLLRALCPHVFARFGRLLRRARRRLIIVVSKSN